VGLLDVALTGDVPSGLPHPVAPDLDLIGPLFPAAMGVALMSFVESVAAGAAVTHTGEDEPDADRELRALGAANLLGGIFRALPSGGGLSQTAVHDNAGASSRMAGAVTGVVSLLTMRFLTDLFADLPQATLGAIVLVSALGLFSLGPLNEIRAIHLRGYMLGLVTLVSVLALGVLEGVLVGVVTSMLMLVHALDHPDIRVVERTRRRLVVRVIGGLYFANAQRFRRTLLALVDEHHPHELVVDLSAVPGIDVTTLTLLPVFDRQLAARGVTLQLAALNPEPLADFRRSPAADALAGRVHRDVPERTGVA